MVVVNLLNMKSHSQEISVEPPANRARKERAAFTLTELLVIIAMVAVLFSLALPGLAGTGGRSRVAQCGSNLKQFTMVLELYGNDNNNNLPQAVSGSFNWPWDINAYVFTNLTRYGATRDMVHCPASPDQNSDAEWAYGSGAFYGENEFHVCGYALTFPGTVALAGGTNINSSLIPNAIRIGSVSIPVGSSSKRVLLADGTISEPGQNNKNLRATYTYTGIPGAFYERAAHLNGNLPAGGNLGMLDGHVEWRKFNDMLPRNNSSPTGITPTFWW